MTKLTTPITLTIKTKETAMLLKELLGQVGLLQVARLRVDVAEVYELLHELGKVVPNGNMTIVKH